MTKRPPVTRVLPDRMTPALCREAPIGSVIKDHDVPGLQLRVHPTSRTWTVYYRARNGVQRKPSIGKFPAMSLSEARRAASDLLQRVAAGDDPSAAWAESRAVPLVRDVAEKYLQHRAQRVAPNTLKSYRYYFDSRIVPKFGTLKIDGVTRSDIDAYLSQLERRSGPSEANHVRVQLRALFYFARDILEVLPADKVNPVTNTQIANEPQRKRYATQAELDAILLAFGTLETRRRTFGRLLFSTGMRISELTQVRGHEFDGASFNLTRHKTFKRIGVKRIDIPPGLIADVKELVDQAGRGVIFPNLSPKAVWLTIRRLADIPPDLQMRDARRTFASYGLSRTGSLEIIAQIFGHTDPRTTKRYAWLMPEAQRTASHNISRDILGD